MWCVSFKTHHEHAPAYGRDFILHLVFGPSVWAELNDGRWQDAPLQPDYTRILILEDRGGGDKALQSEVSVTELLEGMASDDLRLREEIVGLLRRTKAVT